MLSWLFRFGSYFRSYVPYVFGSSNEEVFVSLLFLEGLIIIGIGALFISGYSWMKVADSNNPAAKAYLSEKLFAQPKEYREKQISTGLVLMISGGVFLLLSFIIRLML